jgi:hypothetical protein
MISKKGSWTIAIQPTSDAPPRKITKIIGLNGRGFSVLTPYHKAKSGFVWKMPVGADIDNPGTHAISPKSGLAFTAEDRVKLSYHTDGFAQFSGESPGQITSGIDPDTNEPKGIGLFARPLSAPASSGPSVGITIWGIEDFEEARTEDDLIVFRAPDFYYRGCTPDEANGWILSIYAFPINVVPPIRYIGREAKFDIAIDPSYGHWLNVIQLKAMHLREEKVFLGAYVNAVRSSFKEKSGWALAGPGTVRAPGGRGHNLMAFYPRIPETATGRAPLDRKTSDETEGLDPGIGSKSGPKR